MVKVKISGELTPADLTEQAALANREELDLERFSFSSQRTEELCLHGVDIMECVLTDCALQRARFENMHFSDVVFDHCDLSNARFADCGLRRVIFRNCKLVGAYLADGRLDSVGIQDSVCKYANFSYSHLTSCLFKSSSFAETAFSSCTFVKSELRDCNLTRADLIHAKLKGMDLRTCQLDGALFVAEELKGATVSYEQAFMIARMLGILVE